MRQEGREAEARIVGGVTEDGYAVDSGVTRRVQRPLRDERSDSTTLTGRVYGQRGEQLDLQVGMTGSATPGEQHVPYHHPVVIATIDTSG